MQCFVGGRRSGKTTRLINLSHDTGYPIVTPSAEMAREIEHMAMGMGKAIPTPLCYRSREMLVGAPLRRNVLIDESQSVLEEVLGVRIIAASIDGEALALPASNPAMGHLSFIELLRTWRKERKETRKEEACRASAGILRADTGNHR